MSSYPLVLIPPPYCSGDGPYYHCPNTRWLLHEHRTTKGHSEEKFYSKYLKKFFSDKIHSGWALRFFQWKYIAELHLQSRVLTTVGLVEPYEEKTSKYVMDFTYLDGEKGEKGAFISIEVDEPYVYHTGEPIHYQGCKCDTRRNDWVLFNDCVVIRFSEEQVVTAPNECCREIAKVIAQVSGDSSVLEQFIEIGPLEPHKQWTREEAIEMAARKSRNQYLWESLRLPLAA